MLFEGVEGKDGIMERLSKLVCENLIERVVGRIVGANNDGRLEWWKKKS